MNDGEFVVTWLIGVISLISLIVAFILAIFEVWLISIPLALFFIVGWFIYGAKKEDMVKHNDNILERAQGSVPPGYYDDLEPPIP